MTSRGLDRYLRARVRHAEAYRPRLWLGINNRGLMTASGIYRVSLSAVVGSAAWRCPRTGSGTTSAMPGKWAKLHLMQHSPKSEITTPQAMQDASAAEFPRSLTQSSRSERYVNTGLRQASQCCILFCCI